MITLCQVCGHLIPEPRHRKHSRTCSPECQKQYRAERLSERKQRVCKACGRPKPIKHVKPQGNTVPEAIQVTQ